MNAWFGKDLSNPKEKHVLISDKYGSFKWEKQNSNNNIIGINNEGLSKNMFFSFYFSRYAFNDNHKIEYNPKFKKIENDCKFYLTEIKYSILQEIMKENRIPFKLNKHATVIILMKTKIVDNTVLILSSEIVIDKYLLNMYINNKFEKLFIGEEGKFRKLLKNKFYKNFSQYIINGTNDILEIAKEYWQIKYEATERKFYK